jgi:hypothetical protein
MWGTANEKNEVHFREFIHGKYVNNSTLKITNFLTTESWNILHTALIWRPAIIISSRHWSKILAVTDLKGIAW